LDRDLFVSFGIVKSGLYISLIWSANEALSPEFTKRFLAVLAPPAAFNHCTFQTFERFLKPVLGATWLSND
jgi:hypothetical protein